MDDNRIYRNKSAFILDEFLLFLDMLGIGRTMNMDDFHWFKAEGFVDRHGSNDVH